MAKRKKKTILQKVLFFYLQLLKDVNLIDGDVKINKGTNGRFSKQITKL